jgi:hypothetical protein
MAEPPRQQLRVSTGSGALRRRVPVSWQQREGASGDRSQRTEVALVECEQSARAEALRQDNHREVAEAYIQIGVPVVEVEDDAVLFPVEALHLETAFGNVAKKAPRGIPATTAPQQVVDLG